MAQSSLMTDAMAYRAKYRGYDREHHVMRTNVRIESLDAHPKHRGGVYPSGQRRKSWIEEVMGNGFVKEEVNHGVIAVEEPPAEVVRSRGNEFVCGSTYNVE